MKNFGLIVIFGLALAVAGYFAYSSFNKSHAPVQNEESQITPSITTDTQEQEEVIKTQIKKEIIAKRGQSAENLTITIANIEGDFAKGGASEKDMGGGMWFGAKVDGEWKLVWDGNGIVTCNSLVLYPNFPDTLIPQCFDETAQELITR